MDNLNTPQAQLSGGVTNAIGLVINSTNALLASNGGTGVNNGSSTFTMGGNVTFSGSFPFTGTLTASTNITYPTTGTLVNTAVTTLSSLASIGTVTTGTWNGSIIGGTYGGTGINNGSNTITLAGNLVTSGANSLTLTTTGSTNVTFPTSGTLATVGGNGVAITQISGTSAAMTDSAAINIYIANNSSLLTLTLPATIALGHVFKIIGGGSANWKVAQNAGQSIALENNGANVSTINGTGGSLSSSLSNDCVELTCTAANTLLIMSAGSAGSLTYV